MDDHYTEDKIDEAHLDDIFGGDSVSEASHQEIEDAGLSSSEQNEEMDISRPRKRTLSDVRSKEMSIKKLNSPEDLGFTPMLLRLPGFMGIERNAYSPSSVIDNELSLFENFTEEEDCTAGSEMLLKSATTLRWRIDPRTKTKRSNSRLVKWSDGSWSLMVGHELFELSVQNISSENNFIYGRHSEEGSMECLGKLRDKINIRPFILPSQSHRKYLAAAAAASKRADADVRIKMAVTTADPEKEKQRMIKLEQEKIKQRRKLEAHRRNLKQRSLERVSRTGLTAKFLEEREGEEYPSEDFDKYEEDFIDDTEEPGSVEESQEEEEAEDEEEEKEDIQSSEEEAVMTDEEEEQTKQSTLKKGRRAAIVDEDDE